MNDDAGTQQSRGKATRATYIRYVRTPRFGVQPSPNVSFATRHAHRRGVNCKQMVLTREKREREKHSRRGTVRAPALVASEWWWWCVVGSAPRSASFVRDPGAMARPRASVDRVGRGGEGRSRRSGRKRAGGMKAIMSEASASATSTLTVDG